MAVDISLNPYYDDWDEDKGFHQILFRPGFAPQARELNQLQTILRNQITRFGQNIFLDGTVVLPGGVSVDKYYEYTKIEEVDISGIDTGATIDGASSAMQAIVLQKVDAEGPDPATIYVRYTGGGASDGGRFQDGETLTYTNPDLSSGTLTAAATAASGVGTKVDLDKGIYFTKGVFAAATTQSLIVEKYGVPVGIQEIGLIVAEEIITPEVDSSLFSNAQGTNNFNAPGAHRLRYTLTLIKKEDVDIEDDYFTVVTLKDDVIISSLTRTQYALLGDELARRTYEESGHYTVDPFIGGVEDSGDPNTLNLIVDPGVAYVLGYRVEKPISTVIELNRALDTEIKGNGKIATSYGGYCRTGIPSGIPLTTSHPTVNLVDSVAATIGTARLRAVARESGSIYRFFLFEITMNPAKGFNQVRTISSAGFSATIIDDANAALATDSAKIYDASRSSMIFPVDFSRIKSVTDITSRVQRTVSFTTNGSGQATLDTVDANVTWEDTANWIVAKASTAPATPTFSSAGAQTITLSGLDNSTVYNAVAYVDKTSVTTRARSKTLTTVTSGAFTLVAGRADLLKSDVFELVSVISSAVDVTDRFTIDTGQRDTFYTNGAIVLLPGQTVPSTSLTVTFKYFAHGPGDYFSVDSYNSFVDLVDYDYKDIPTYVGSNGTQYFLADVLDFRSVKATGFDDYTSAGSAFNEPPKSGETVQADIEYYLPRVDTVYLTRDGVFGVVEGDPSLRPSSGHIPESVMPIYSVTLNAATLTEKDLSLQFLDNRRYTMRDIGKIEKRISRIEEWTTLSLLESSTESLTVLDNDGNSRFKSGFFVDTFRDHAFADLASIDYKAAIDPTAGELRPTFAETNVKMKYTASGSTGVVVRDDLLMLSYSEVVEINQPVASSSINVNPYNVITNIGKVTLSPATDEWRDVVTETVLTTIQSFGTVVAPTATAATATRTAVSALPAQNWSNWTWGWAGGLDSDSIVTRARTRNAN